jgi:protection of telomeres protein 1
MTIVFPNDTIPTSHFIDAYGDEKALPHESTPKGVLGSEPTREEQLYAIKLHSAVNFSTMRTAMSASVKPAVVKRRASPTEAANVLAVRRDPKWSLLKDVTDFSFYNLVCEVVKVYSWNGRVEVYVTDYTENQLFFPYETDENDNEDDGDESDQAADPYGSASFNKNKKKWPGPPGKLTMQIKMWPPNDIYAADKVDEGSIWYFKNVRVKYNAGSNVLEGNLHGDRHSPNQIDIRKLDPADERIHHLKSRKRKLQQQNNPNPFSLAKTSNAGPANAGDPKKRSKSQKKKSKKQKREQENGQTPSSTRPESSIPPANSKKKIYNERGRVRIIIALSIH